MADLAFIDTSGQQHPNGAAIDWHAVKASGIDGVYVKLSEGGILDPHGQQDVRDARAAGLHAGVYHFARPDLNSAAAEATAFNGFRAGLPTDCPPCLDTETGPITAAWNDAFAALVPDELGYTYRSALGTLDIPDTRIWAAVPNATSRTVSVNGATRTFVGVQYGIGTIPGIQTPTDLDYFDPALIGATDMNASDAYGAAQVSLAVILGHAPSMDEVTQMQNDIVQNGWNTAFNNAAARAASGGEIPLTERLQYLKMDGNSGAPQHSHPASGSTTVLPHTHSTPASTTGPAQ